MWWRTPVQRMSQMRMSSLEPSYQEVPHSRYVGSRRPMCAFLHCGNCHWSCRWYARILWSVYCSHCAQTVCHLLCWIFAAGHGICESLLDIFDSSFLDDSIRHRTWYFPRRQLWGSRCCGLDLLCCGQFVVCCRVSYATAFIDSWKGQLEEAKFPGIFLWILYHVPPGCLVVRSCEIIDLPEN